MDLAGLGSSKTEEGIHGHGQETQNKAQAVLRAAELAEHGLDTRL